MVELSGGTCDSTFRVIAVFGPSALAGAVWMAWQDGSSVVPVLRDFEPERCPGIPYRFGELNPAMARPVILPQLTSHSRVPHQLRRARSSI